MFEIFLPQRPASTRRVNGQNQRQGSHIKASRVESRNANGSWGTRLAMTTLRTRTWKPVPPHIQPAVSATVIYWPPTQTCPIMSVLHVTVTKVCGGELGAPWPRTTLPTTLTWQAVGAPTRSESITAWEHAGESCLHLNKCIMMLLP